jgi:hypothetical protein
MENGKVVQCSREIAVIFYLTKDWKVSTPPERGWSSVENRIALI